MCAGGVLAALVLGALLLAFAIAERWMHIGHGPFLTLYEILLSNLFSLGAVYALAFWRVPLARPGAAVALPVLMLLGIWSLNVSRDPVPLPPTYENGWLWVHVTMGKLFLGTALVGVGLAGLLLLRRLVAPAMEGEQVDALDGVAWRFMALAFVLHSLMLIAGAVWAQDAWGRYWDWDPLETWAFMTWLALGATLHLRLTYRIAPWAGWCLIIGVFVLAFLTFFGVPFLSLAPHKGAV
jgi:ABC-type transport system involved in cytochrome c biogenesis permease subunit